MMKHNQTHAPQLRLAFVIHHATVLKYLFFLLAAAIVCTPLAGSAASSLDDTSPEIDLTPEEQAYLKAHPVLRMGVGVAFPPIQYVEVNDGKYEFKGVAAETVQLLEKRLGVRMEPVWGLTFAEALKLGQAGEIDVFPCLSWTPDRAEYLVFTGPYLSYPLVIVTRDDSPFIGSIEDLNGRKVAENKAMSTYSKVRNEYPELKLDYVFEKDTQAILEAVSFGRAEACIVDLAVASYVINSRGLNNLKVAAPTRWRDNPLAMGVARDKAILAGILQKGLDSITYAETDAIRQRWFGLRYASLVNPVLVRRILLQGGGAFIVVVGFILWRNRRLRREIAERKRAEENLKASEERHLVTLKAVNDGIWDWNVASGEIYFSPLFYGLLGYADKEFSSAYEAWRPLIHPDDVNNTEHHFRQSSRDGQAFNMDLRMLTKDQEWKWVQVRGKAIERDAEGKVLRMVGTLSDITERKRMEARLLELATIDGLTGLNNRRRFMELGELLFKTARRYESPFAVAILDIDNFKSINDTWGHEAGDLILKSLSQAMRSSFRASDVIGRIGGDEFAVIMPETDNAEALSALERLRTGVEAMRIDYGGNVMSVTISCGVALYVPDCCVNIDLLLKSADNALYESKNCGRNRIVVCDCR